MVTVKVFRAQHNGDEVNVLYVSYSYFLYFTFGTYTSV